MNDLQKATALVHFLIEQGFKLTICNGGESIEFAWTNNAQTVIAHLNQTGLDDLLTARDGRTCFIQLVYQGEPESLIADYSVSLENLIFDFESIITETEGAH